MEIERTAIDGVLIIRPKKFEDARGFFAPVLNRSALREAGVDHDWVQENQSLSLKKGTVRGLHFQRPPFAQAKLIRVLRGAIMDVCVDLRENSTTRGLHISTTLTAENLVSVYVPAGFAHGFCTLVDDTEVLYRVSNEWAPSHEEGLIWNDPDLAISWPVGADEVVLSERDASWPSLAAYRR